MNSATIARTATRNGASVSQKSVGTESTEEVVDPVSMPTTPEKDALDHALTRIGSHATPASSSWRQSFTPIKWIKRSASTAGAAGSKNTSHHKRNQSADAVMASTLVSWTSVATEDGIVSLATGETRDKHVAGTSSISSAFVVSPRATQQASELLRRAATCDQNEEEETTPQFDEDHDFDRITIDFRERSKADKEKPHHMAQLKQGSWANNKKDRAPSKNRKQPETSTSSTSGGKSPTAPEHTAAPETLLERFGRIADTTCGGAACNCMEDAEVEKGVEMIHVNDSLLDEEASDEDDMYSDGEQSCWTEVEVSIAPAESRTNLWTKIVGNKQPTSPTSAIQNVSFSTKMRATRGGHAIAHMESDTEEAKEENVVESKKGAPWSLRPIRSHGSKLLKKTFDQRKLKQHRLEGFAKLFATPPRSPPSMKHIKDSSLFTDLDLPIASPRPEDKDVGLEVLADLSTPPRRVPRSRSTDIPSVSAETAVVNNLSMLRRSKLDPRFFVDTSYGPARSNRVIKSVAVNDRSDRHQTPSDNGAAQERPAQAERLACRTPSLERLEARCDNKVVLANSPLRPLDLWNAAADKTTIRQNTTRMRQIAGLESSDEVMEKNVAGNATNKANANEDDDMVGPDLLTPLRSNVGSEEKERVLRNISRIRTAAGLPDAPSLNVKKRSSSCDRSNEKSRSEILLPSPGRSTSNSPDRLQRSSSADRALTAQPMKLRDYIQGRYSKHAVEYHSIEKFFVNVDGCDELPIEQVYQKPDVGVQREENEERDAAPDFDLVKLKKQFSEDETSFMTQDKSPMNIHAFGKGRGKAMFQIGLLNKYRWTGKKKPSEISIPVKSISLDRSKFASSLCDLRQLPATMDDLVSTEVRKETDELEMTMMMEEDAFRLEDETDGIEAFASSRHLLAIVPVGAPNNAMNNDSRRPWQRLRSIGGKVKL